MTKPANVGAPRPINTLSNNSTTVRTPLGISSSSRSFPSSPPPAKRQKVDESNPNTVHSHATFTLVDPPTPRKLSVGSVSVADSQRSVASNMSASQLVVPEYRHVDRHMKHKRKRSRTSRGDGRVAGQENTEGYMLESIPPSKSDEDTTDDEVHIINPQKNPADSHQPTRQPERRPILDFANRFKQSNPRREFGRVIDKVEKRNKRAERHSSPDELAPSLEEIEANQAAKRPKKLSSSLSTRGNIQPTGFKGASTVRPYVGVGPGRDPSEDKKKADSIIGAGLRILRGASGQCKYDAGYNDDPDPCFLSVREIGHTLFPVDQEKNLLKSYAYLTLDLKRVMSVCRAKNDENFIVKVNSRGVANSNSAGPILMIEFASKPELHRFFQWLAIYRESGWQVEIKDSKSSKLQDDINQFMQRVKSHRIITDAETETRIPSIADDIKVMQHNHNSRVLEAKIRPLPANESETRPKIRYAMKTSPVSRPNANGIAASKPWEAQLASPRRQTRTTRSTFALIDSPDSSEPEPEGWTSLNPGWEKEWRGSLVYPHNEKNRATIDKEDIQRLDEGQFLNDNIIIFYLRYLQKHLEDEKPDLAKRVYFQNTFFYDKLKPTKTGQGINYDSVKTWTSKVDLFSKDYIIVPINEYSHWYVAIICNAPKLLPSSDRHTQIDASENGGNATPNAVRITQEPTRAASPNGVSNDSNNHENVVLSPQDVVENFRRMSIDNSPEPSNETKPKVDKSSEEEADSALAKRNQEVYEIDDLDNPTIEVEHISTTPSPQSRKKTGKGPRKCDPSQPRIITLDSLGATHSPTCIYLKQYLIAELKDKKGIEIPAPGAMGTTAKGVPEQTNHCDCGLYLLGYIQHFLLNPDNFVKSLLQRDERIEWKLDPSALRNNIRHLIFKLQKERQEREDHAQEQKRQAKINRSQAKVEQPLSHPTTPVINTPHSPPKSESMSQTCHDDETDKSKSPFIPSLLRPSSSKGSGAVIREATDPEHLPFSRDNPIHGMTKIQTTAPCIRNDGSRTVLQAETGDSSKLEGIWAKPKLDPHIVGSPRKAEPTSDDETHQQVPGTSRVSPVRYQAAECHSLSPEGEGINFRTDHIRPLTSQTPSSQGSRSVTPLDPVVVDDLSIFTKGRPSQSPQRHSGGRQKRLVVELPSANVQSSSPRQDGKIDGQKQTGHVSSYFAKNRQAGERVTAAKMRKTPQNNIIDLSDD
ncbi:hypothetical protein NUW58_g6250 [Xylaria curta]|uniref:Uncharacterized protein n=1 Tax=Xylaria curta TaxID=42375 RepID=A0ACC1NWC6_9PEZI|nr:hypothetical protein NUW58_g6250 [Xylaria curta]